MTETSNRTTIFWAIFALFLSTMIIHAVIFPLNGSTPDEWTYFHLGHVGETTFYRTDRQFAFLYTNFLEWVLPGNTPSRTVTQAIFISLNAALLYIAVRRFFPTKLTLAYFVAFFYITYYPHNQDLARTLFSAGVYTWMQLLIMLNFVCFYEAFYIRNKLLAVFIMLLGALCGFMAIRSNEGNILIILSTPVWLIFLAQKWNRQTFSLMSIWVFIVGLAMWRFITVTLPMMSSSYSSTYLPDQAFSISKIVDRTLLFYQLAFPLEHSFIPESDYMFPALLVSFTVLIAFYLFKRKNTSDETWSWQTFWAIILTGFAGFYYVAAGAGAWVYSGFTAEQYLERMFFFSQLGQGLILGAVAYLVSHILRAIFSVRLILPLSIIIGFFGFMGAHWYYESQLYASNLSADTRYFHENLEMFRDITGLIPYVEDDSIVILFCERNPEYAPLLWSPVTVYAGSVIYDDLRLAHQEEVEFETDRIVNRNLHRNDERVFAYNQIIGLECVENRWRILPYLPESIAAPNSVAATLYNPYLRIENGFLPIERTRMLSWGTVRTQGYQSTERANE